ncbi:MAG: aromatic ring-hydroxylating dioxygenase subunit alpha [Acidimicrobiales bacterium]|nr:aromatic ring-hydroxylating dioxygenase subunit alpha [Acidimicrobiales bacterium]MCB9371461.1 aromatic ring-hydroxylating dioxygenase subunit alpha [Microthrixaceae bacterium]
MDATLEATIRRELVENRDRTAPPPDAVPVPPLPAGRYHDERLFALEGEHLWRRTWLYAAHTSELTEPGAYVTFERSGAPIVVVSGEDGEVRAFYNSCRHRGAPVVRDDCGTAKRLTCQYHSWSYGLDGHLKAVPDARSFAGLELDALGLVPVRCEVWEGWVFVNEDPDAAPLVEFLGPLCEQMLEVNGPSLRKIGTQSHVVPANWKAMVDAFLEVYHIRTVHPDNAALLYDDTTATVAMLPNGHSRLSVAVKPELLGVMDPSPAADNPSVGALWRETSTSFGWFPNIVAPLDTGAFPLLCMWPLDRRTTELELVWFAPDWGDGDTPEENTLRMTLFETVMAQDTANMGGIQRSVESRGARPFQIGWHERLIHHFHRAVDLAIGDEVPAELRVSPALDGYVERA